MLLCCILQQCR